MKTKYLNKKFLTYYAIIFVLLYIFFSLIRFLGQLPILLIITFFVTYYITNNTSLYDNKIDNKIDNKMDNNSENNMTSYLSPSYSIYNNENNYNQDVMDSSNDYSKFNSKNNISYSKDTLEPEIIIGSSNVVSKNSPLNNSNILPKQSSLGYRSFS